MRTLEIKVLPDIYKMAENDTIYCIALPATKSNIKKLTSWRTSGCYLFFDFVVIKCKGNPPLPGLKKRYIKTGFVSAEKASKILKRKILKNSFLVYFHFNTE